MVIGGYNSVLEQVEQVSATFNVTFIDTDFIAGPMWDSATDWNHSHGKVAREESVYVIATVMNLVS